MPGPNQGTLLLATLVGALLMRGARKLEEWAPPRRDYSLSVKVSKGVHPLLVEEGQTLTPTLTPTQTPTPTLALTNPTPNPN
jgi:hypothetical protein